MLKFSAFPTLNGKMAKKREIRKKNTTFVPVNRYTF